MAPPGKASEAVAALLVAALLAGLLPGAFGETSLWPMFRGGPDHRAATFGDVPSELAVTWTAPTGPGPTSPVAARGLVFVGTAGGAVRAFWDSNGTEAWSFSAGSPVAAEPSLDGGVLYAVTQDGRLLALSAGRGEFLWDLRLPSTLSYSVGLTLDGDTLYLASEGTVFRVDGGPAGKLVWNRSVGEKVRGAVTVGNGRVYAATEGGKAASLFQADGRVDWSVSLGAGTPEGFTPVLEGERLYLATRGRASICLSALNGSELWSAQMRSSSAVSPALSEGRMVVGSENGQLSALSALNGTELWRTDAGSKLTCAPAAADGRVFVGTDDGWLREVDCSDGRMVRSFHVNGTLTSSPAISRGQVFLTTREGSLIALGRPVVPPPAARLEVRPAESSVEDEIRFSGSGSFDPSGGQIAAFLFDFGDGSSTGWTANDSAVHAYHSKGTFRATLKVRNGVGNESLPAEREVRVQNFRPQLELQLPRDARAGRAVQLSALASDPDGRLVLFEWDFEGDGTFDLVGPSADNATHAYPAAGTYRPVLRATDDNGTFALASAALVVSPAAPAAAPAGLPMPVLAATFPLAALALLGAAAATETGKYKLLTVLFVPLYVRLKRDEVLDNYTRGKIHGYIIANPGDNYNSIRDALDLSNGILAHHLHTLEREGLVQSMRDGMYRRFFPANARLPPEDEGHFNIQKRIVAVVRAHPGISQKEIAQLVGVSSPTVNYHVNVLLTARMIRVDKIGRKTHCYALEQPPT